MIPASAIVDPTPIAAPRLISRPNSDHIELELDVPVAVESPFAEYGGGASPGLAGPPLPPVPGPPLPPPPGPHPPKPPNQGLPGGGGGLPPAVPVAKGMFRVK